MAEKHGLVRNDALEVKLTCSSNMHPMIILGISASGILTAFDANGILAKTLDSFEDVKIPMADVATCDREPTRRKGQGLGYGQDVAIDVSPTERT